MIYNSIYQDELGNTKQIFINEEDSKLALINDYNYILGIYNPTYVSFKRIVTKPGEALHLQISVIAPSDYLTSREDKSPKACASMNVYIICYPGYPLTKVKAYYENDHYLASPNVFITGDACIDKWKPMTSSLITVVDKLVRDIVHDPLVVNYEDPANKSLNEWHKTAVNSGRFPTISTNLLYSNEVTNFRINKPNIKKPSSPPPLPVSKHNERR